MDCQTGQKTAIREDWISDKMALVANNSQEEEEEERTIGRMSHDVNHLIVLLILYLI